MSSAAILMRFGVSLVSPWPLCRLRARAGSRPRWPSGKPADWPAGASRLALDENDAHECDNPASLSIAERAFWALCGMGGPERVPPEKARATWRRALRAIEVMNNRPNSEMDFADFADDKSESDTNLLVAPATVRSEPPLTPLPLAPRPVGRFGSGAPLAPPRPSSSSVLPRPSRPPSVTPAPPAVAEPPAPGSSSRDAIPAPPSQESQREPSLLDLMHDELDAVRRLLIAKEAEIRVVVAQRDARIVELERTRSSLTAQTSVLAAREAALEAREASLSAREVALETREASLSSREAALETRESTQEMRKAPQSEAGEPAKGDDLKAIRGIGPAFERELQKLGVHTYVQIAAWTAADIEAIAPKIRAKAERIRRDGWVTSAAQLVAERT